MINAVIAAVGTMLVLSLSRVHVVIAIIVVLVELWAIAWIQNRWMQTPFWRAVLQVVVGGGLVLAVGVLIGSG